MNYDYLGIVAILGKFIPFHSLLFSMLSSILF